MGKVGVATTTPVGGIRQGGALYLLNSTTQVSRCVLVRNGHAHDPYGVIYADGGLTTMTNVLAVYGQSGNGIYVQNGDIRIEQSTIATNAGWGVWGAAMVHNSIVWGNSSGGITNAAGVSYTLSQENHPGLQNIVTDPLFTDSVYFHLKSSAGRLSAGYFSGDAWESDSRTTSPAIDAGDPASDHSQEPEPRGTRINLGAYGNTPVASKTMPKGSFVIIR